MQFSQSLIGYIIQASWQVKGVIIVLGLASVLSWTIIGLLWQQCLKTRYKINQFNHNFGLRETSRNCTNAY